MVDDHPLILEGYKSKLQQSFISEETAVFIDTANCSDVAFHKIVEAGKEKPYDIVILDIGLPASADRKFLSGEDLGKEIRKKAPETLLMVLTMFNENIRLLNILKNINPEGFLIKSDISPVEFIQAFRNVLRGKVHYSHTIVNLARREMTKEIILNENDQSILFFLAEGIRTKDLVDKVPLSLTAIEKRKKKLKEIFEVEDGSDLALISRARKMGFL